MILDISLLDVRVGNVLVDTASSSTAGGSNFDETVVSPSGSPGVLNEEVVLTTLGSVTNSSDGVVDGGTAGGAGDDTTRVSLEDVGISSDGDGVGLRLKSRLNGVNILADELEGGLATHDFSVHDTLGGVVLASTVKSGVGVVLSLLEGVVHQVAPGEVVPATAAAVVLPSTRAVNELLLGKGVDNILDIDGVGR